MLQDLTERNRSGPAWYAVKSQPRKEALAGLHLERQGFHTFLPMIKAVDMRVRTRGALKLSPFFGGYLFVRLDLGVDRWRSVNGTIGVSHLVQFGAFPSPAPAGLVEELQEFADEQNVIRMADDLRVGDTVQIVGGAFDRYKGVLSCTSDRERVTILLQLMSREVRVSVHRAEVMLTQPA